MRGFVFFALVLCACEAANKPDPVGPAGTGSVITISGTFGGSESSSSSGASSGSTSGTDGSSSSSGGPVCENEGDTCENDGFCIAIDGGFACGHGQPGDPCVLPGDCISMSCHAQPESVEAAGICTGGVCDAAMVECEVDGTCIQLDEDTLWCSHGEIGEPCLSDADCDELTCQEYAVEGGTVLVCA